MPKCGKCVNWCTYRTPNANASENSLFCFVAKLPKHSVEDDNVADFKIKQLESRIQVVLVQDWPILPLGAKKNETLQ